MNNRNTELTILKALGIISVVSCHLGINIFNIFGIPISSSNELFPEYSYNIPLFIFTSGYFYKTIYEKDIIDLIKKRFVSIKKYLNCNIFYFILCFILINLGIFSRDIEFNFKSLFIEPFLGGFQFYFNGPGWFVPFLFLLQISFTISRKIVILSNKSLKDLSNRKFKQEFIFLIILIILGLVSTLLSRIYPVINDNVTIMHSILRILFGLQFFQLGFLYKEFIENRVKYSFKSFLLLLITKIAFILTFGNYTFSLRTVKFNNSIILPVIVSILGILYCLHLSKFIAKMSNRINHKIIAFICFIGNNTWSIMIHHLLVKWCLLKIYKLDFIPEYIANIGNYLISPILCILLPIGFAYLYERILTNIKGIHKKASA